MPKINKKKLEEMSRSKYGKYTPPAENKFLAIFYKVFLTKSLVRSSLESGITAGVVVYWFLTKGLLPVYLWFGYLFFIGLAGYIYWGYEKKRLGREMQKTEAELQGIYEEIQERKSFFDGLREQFDRSKN